MIDKQHQIELLKIKLVELKVERDSKQGIFDIAYYQRLINKLYSELLELESK